MAEFDEPQDFEDFTTVEEGMGALFGEPVAAGVTLQQQQQGTALPPFIYTDINLQMHAPEWFPFDITVKGVKDRAAQSIGLNLSTLDPHKELEAYARRFVDPMVDAATYTTTAILNLKEQELTVRREALVKGNAAQGHIDYLIKGPQGSLPVKMVKTKDLFTPANQGQLLAQMSAVRDQAKANPSQDVFGAMTNGQEWRLFKYEQGGDKVVYEVYQLSVLQEWEVFLAHLEKLLAALVGILRYQAGVME